MSSELARWSATNGIERVHDREMAVVRKNVGVAMAKVQGITEVAHTALMGTGLLSMTQHQLELQNPEAAVKLDMIDTKAVMALGRVIDRLGSQW